MRYIKNIVLLGAMSLLDGCTKQQQPSDKSLLDSTVTDKYRKTTAWNTNAQATEIVETDFTLNSFGDTLARNTAFYLGKLNSVSADRPGGDLFLVNNTMRSDPYITRYKYRPFKSGTIKSGPQPPIISYENIELELEDRKATATDEIVTTSRVVVVPAIGNETPSKTYERYMDNQADEALEIKPNYMPFSAYRKQIEIKQAAFLEAIKKKTKAAEESAKFNPYVGIKPN